MASEGNRAVNLQVKAYNDYGWISGGGLNEAIAGGRCGLFNRARGHDVRADFVVFLTPARPGSRRQLPDTWRCFVLPVAEAERLWWLHIDAVVRRPKRDGSVRAPRGAVQGWVGPGPKMYDWGPDLSAEYAPFEGAFHLLDGSDGGDGSATPAAPT